MELAGIMEISSLHPMLGHEAIHPVKTVVNPTSPIWECVNFYHEYRSEPHLSYWESVSPSSTTSLDAKISSLYFKAFITFIYKNIGFGYSLFICL